MKKIENAVVIGAGALGILFGRRMTEALGKEHVFFAADRDRVERYRQQGFYYNDKKCDLSFVPCDEKGKTADLILFAVKYTGLAEAIESARNFAGEDTLFLSVINGIVSERDIAAVYGEKGVLGCIAQGSDAVRENNRIYCSVEGLLQIGVRDQAQGEEDERIQAVIDLLSRSGIDYRLPKDIYRQMWNKLMFNTGVNQVTTVFETNYGGVQAEGKARDTMVAAMKEVQTVAKYEGITLTDEEVEEWLAVLSTLGAENMPSMRQDALAHRKTEVELFSGTICSLGKKHGVPTPVNDFLYARIKEMEQQWAK